jgi:hypothetical protein
VKGDQSHPRVGRQVLPEPRQPLRCAGRGADQRGGTGGAHPLRAQGVTDARGLGHARGRRPRPVGGVTAEAQHGRPAWGEVADELLEHAIRIGRRPEVPGRRAVLDGQADEAGRHRAALGRGADLHANRVAGNARRGGGHGGVTITVLQRAGTRPDHGDDGDDCQEAHEADLRTRTHPGAQEILRRSSSSPIDLRRCTTDPAPLTLETRMSIGSIGNVNVNASSLQQSQQIAANGAAGQLDRRRRPRAGHHHRRAAAMGRGGVRPPGLRRPTRHRTAAGGCHRAHRGRAATPGCARP